jgi:hypothetical protein
MLRDLWSLDDDQMEHSHDVIQWMFPSDVPSTHHSHAPVLTDEQVYTMWRDPIIRDSIKSSASRYVQFLMATLPNWLHVMDHNYLRITRVLRCLWIMRMGDEFLRWRDMCDKMYQGFPERIPEKTYHYWMNAHNDETFKA